MKTPITPPPPNLFYLPGKEVSKGRDDLPGLPENLGGNATASEEDDSSDKEQIAANQTTIITVGMADSGIDLTDEDPTVVAVNTEIEGLMTEKVHTNSEAITEDPWGTNEVSEDWEDETEVPGGNAVTTEIAGDIADTTEDTEYMEDTTEVTEDIKVTTEVTVDAKVTTEVIVDVEDKTEPIVDLADKTEIPKDLEDKTEVPKDLEDKTEVPQDLEDKPEYGDEELEDDVETVLATITASSKHMSMRKILLMEQEQLSLSSSIYSLNIYCCIHATKGVEQKICLL